MTASERADHQGSLETAREAPVVPPDPVTRQEARVVLELLARLKRHRFGRLAVAVSDGRIVDVEVTEKVDRNLLQRL